MKRIQNIFPWGQKEVLFSLSNFLWGKNYVGQHQHLREKRPEIRRSGKRIVARRTFKDAFDLILMDNKFMCELRLWKENNENIFGGWPIWKLFAFSLLVIALPFPTENRKISCLFKSTPIWLLTNNKENVSTCNSNQLFLLNTVLLHPLSMLTCLEI